MSMPQENPVVFTTSDPSPITELHKEGDNGYEDAASSGCFRRYFCFGWDENESHNYLLQGRGGANNKEAWLTGKLKNLKEFSELVAGPKWKNFIRKIGRCCNPRKYNKQTPQFRYSPSSYALNFAGEHHEELQEEDGNLLHSFSSRFAPHHAFINDQ